MRGSPKFLTRASSEASRSPRGEPEPENDVSAGSTTAFPPEKPYLVAAPTEATGLVLSSFARSFSSAFASGSEWSGSRGWLNMRRKRSVAALVTSCTSLPPTPTTPNIVAASGATIAMSVKSKCIVFASTALNATPLGSRCISAPYPLVPREDTDPPPARFRSPIERRRNGRRSEPHDPTLFKPDALSAFSAFTARRTLLQLPLWRKCGETAAEPPEKSPDPEPRSEPRSSPARNASEDGPRGGRPEAYEATAAAASSSAVGTLSLCSSSGSFPKSGVPSPLNSPSRLPTDPRLRALDRDAMDVIDARFSLDPTRGCCGRKCALRRCDVGLLGGLLV